jgi:hypothetical protein
MNHVETIDTFCAAWNEIDGGRRAKILAAALAPDATYTDPTVHTVGIPQLVAHIDVVFARYPGSRIVRTSEVDSHHGLARFAWKKILADGKSLPEGIDIEFTDTGQLSRIVGLSGIKLGPVSSAAGQPSMADRPATTSRS